MSHTSSSGAATAHHGSDGLTPSKLAALRKDLMHLQKQKRAQLLAADDPVAVDDQVTRIQTQVAREALRSVEAALARLDNDLYGRCVHCSSQIPAERLEIVPHTDSCVTCCARRAAR